MHSWGDDWFEKNGDDLVAAMNFIRKEYKRRTGKTIHIKEKWGTIRWEFISAALSSHTWPIHGYFYPGYLCYQWPKWVMPIEFRIGELLYKLGIYGYLIRKQLKHLKATVLLAAEKWPHIEKEITEDFKWSIDNWDEL